MWDDCCQKRLAVFSLSVAAKCPKRHSWRPQIDCDNAHYVITKPNQNICLFLTNSLVIILNMPQTPTLTHCELSAHFSCTASHSTRLWHTICRLNMVSVSQCLWLNMSVLMMTTAQHLLKHICGTAHNNMRTCIQPNKCVLFTLMTCPWKVCPLSEYIARAAISCDSYLMKA